MISFKTNEYISVLSAHYPLSNVGFEMCVVCKMPLLETPTAATTKPHWIRIFFPLLINVLMAEFRKYIYI